MNADFNPRGGLTVDRDSLHASPEYARQVAAAKQLQERSVNADVEKAVELLTQFAKHEQNCIGDYWGKDCALLSIAVMTKALRDQEAEITRHVKVLADCFRMAGADPDGNEDWRIAPDALRAVTDLRRDYDEVLDWQDRAEKADALLRLVVHQWPSLGCESFHHRKADQHGIAEECEPLRRWLALYGCITAHLGGEQ